MEEKDYNKIGRLFQFLNNNFSQRHYQYGGFNGNHKTYSTDDIDFQEDTLRLIDKLMLIKVEDFYDIEYLKSNGYPDRYYNEELVKKSEKEYGFHYQLPTILYYYLFSHFKKAALHFLKEIDSKEFKSLFSHLVKRDKYLLQYPTHIHKEIFKYLDSRIQLFHLLHHQWNWLSDISYSDGSMTTYKIKRIDSCINNLEGFDFSKINLIQVTND